MTKSNQAATHTEEAVLKGGGGEVWRKIHEIINNKKIDELQ